jgi:single-strand DNA-binding protein
LHRTRNGKAVCNFSIESVRYFKDKDEGGIKKETSFFDIQAEGKLAELCYSQAKKGRGLRVVGRLKQERWQGADGKSTSKIYIVAEHVEHRSEIVRDPEITCDRCGKDISIEFYEEGGNCTACGDNLCKECAGDWDEDGQCRACHEKETQNANV